jgi:hypothetical protein
MSRLEIFDEWDLAWVDVEDLDDPLLADVAVDEEVTEHESVAWTRLLARLHNVTSPDSSS